MPENENMRTTVNLDGGNTYKGNGPEPERVNLNGTMLNFASLATIATVLEKTGSVTVVNCLIPHHEGHGGMLMGRLLEDYLSRLPKDDLHA